MRAVMGSSGMAANTIRYDAKSLIRAAEVRAQQYQTLGEEMRQLKQSFAQITALGPSFKGRGAEKIKAFYQAQETVVNAWLRLIEKQVAFLNGIAGEIDDRNLGGATRVQIPFLESNLSIAYWRSRDVVNDQKESINEVLDSISALIPVGKLNTEDVERQLDKANKAQTKMSEDVRDLDRTLLNEYQQVIGDVPQIVSLYSALENATRQGADVEPLHFNAGAFYHSDAYKIQSDLEKQKSAYLSFKKQQEKARQVSMDNESVKMEKLDPKSKLYLNKAKLDYKNGKISRKLYHSIESGIMNTGTAFIQNAVENKVTDKVAEKISKEIVTWFQNNTTDFMDRGLVAGMVSGGTTSFSEPPSWLTDTIRTGAIRSAPLVGSILDFSLQVSRGENPTDALIKTGGHLGAGLAGAAIGTAIGGPGIGTLIGFAIGILGGMAFDWIYDNKDKIANQAKKIGAEVWDRSKKAGKEIINLSKDTAKQIDTIEKDKVEMKKQILNKVSDISKQTVNQAAVESRKVGKAVSGFFGNLGSIVN
ncbi:MAG: T7SS effector LXG polymorphic toxin [Sporolactobacillus sp.]